MRTTDVINHFGRSVSATAQAFGITRSAVYQWGELVPERIAWKAQILTGGVLRVDPSLYARKASRPA
jgi:transposase-like protein